MKIVIALDSFKGSCSAQAACAAVAQGLRRVDEELELVEMPVSDGGEGLLSALAESPQLKGARWQQQRWWCRCDSAERCGRCPPRLQRTRGHHPLGWA